jgi:hypothetical protein
VATQRFNIAKSRIFVKHWRRVAVSPEGDGTTFLTRQSFELYTPDSPDYVHVFRRPILRSMAPPRPAVPARLASVSPGLRPWGTSPLMEAALWDDVDAVRLGLAQGLSPHDVDQWGRQALHYAAMGNSVRAGKELIRYGANIKAVTGRSEEIEAVTGPGDDVSGAIFPSPDKEYSQGATPLHLAALCGCAEFVRLLLRHGAVRDAKTTPPPEKNKKVKRYMPAECARGQMEKVRFVGPLDTDFKLRGIEDLKPYQEVLDILEERGVRNSAVGRQVESILIRVHGLFYM